MTYTSPTSSLTPFEVVNEFISNQRKIESLIEVKNFVENIDSTKSHLKEEINSLLKEMKNTQSQIATAKPQEYKDFLVHQGIKEYHGTDDETAQDMLEWCADRRDDLGDALKELWGNDKYFSRWEDKRISNLSAKKRYHLQLKTF